MHGAIVQSERVRARERGATSLIQYVLIHSNMIPATVQAVVKTLFPVNKGGTYV